MRKTILMVLLVLIPFLFLLEFNPEIYEGWIDDIRDAVVNDTEYYEFDITVDGSEGYHNAISDVIQEIYYKINLEPTMEILAMDSFFEVEHNEGLFYGKAVTIEVVDREDWLYTIKCTQAEVLENMHCSYKDENIRLGERGSWVILEINDVVGILSELDIKQFTDEIGHSQLDILELEDSAPFTLFVNIVLGSEGKHFFKGDNELYYITLSESGISKIDEVEIESDFVFYHFESEAQSAELILDIK